MPREMKLIVSEVEHQGDVDASLADLREAGCTIVDYDLRRSSDSMVVTALVPDEIKTLGDLQARCDFACVD